MTERRTDGPLVLGIETSCDETGVGIVRGRTLLAVSVIDDPAASAMAAATKSPQLAKRLAITLAAESASVSALAAEGDAAIASLIPLIQHGPETTTAAAGPDFGGVEPQAVRVVEVSNVQAGPAQRLLGECPSLAWTYGPGCRDTMTRPHVVVPRGK